MPNTSHTYTVVRLEVEADMKRLKKRFKDDSIWVRELRIPEDSVWRKDLIPESSIWNRDLRSFVKRKSHCLQCPVLMLEEEHRCSRYEHIPDDIWDGVKTCPLFES